MEKITLDVSRQLLVNGMTQEKQKKLNESKVLVVGAGGLATTATTYLAMSGIKQITIVDYDHIENSNLHRQTLFSQQDLGKNKAEAVKNYLLERNPNLIVKAINSALDIKSLLILLNQNDVVLDCTDMLSFSYMLNDAAIATYTPVIFSNASRMTGQLFTMVPNKDKAFSCFRCVWPENIDSVESCEILGVLGPVPGTMGCLQALEAIKLLSGFYDVSEGMLYHFDFYTLNITKIAVPTGDCRHNITEDSLFNYYSASLVFEGGLEEAIKKGYSLIDIRDENEIKLKPCKFLTKNYKAEQLLHSPSLFLNKSNHYLFICSNGTRSKSLVRYLQHQGFTQSFAYQGDL